MPAAKRNIGDEVRGITRKALERGKLDRSAVRKVTGEVRKRLAEIERVFAQDLRLAARAGKDAAAQSMNAALISGAMAARIASGMLAGIADSLAQKTPRRPR
jgi:hypothetical protein